MSLNSNYLSSVISMIGRIIGVRRRFLIVSSHVPALYNLYMSTCRNNNCIVESSLELTLISVFAYYSTTYYI
jgi:hypothetical protein